MLTLPASVPALAYDSITSYRGLFRIKKWYDVYTLINRSAIVVYEFSITVEAAAISAVEVDVVADP